MYAQDSYQNLYTSKAGGVIIIYDSVLLEKNCEGDSNLSLNETSPSKIYHPINIIKGDIIKIIPSHSGEVIALIQKYEYEYNYMTIINNEELKRDKRDVKNNTGDKYHGYHGNSNYFYLSKTEKLPVPGILQFRWLYNSNEYFAMLLSDGTFQINHKKNVHDPIVRIKLRIGKYKELNEIGEGYWAFLPQPIDFIFVDKNYYYDLFNRDNDELNNKIFAYILLKGGKIYSLIFDNIAMGDDGMMKIDTMNIYLQGPLNNVYMDHAKTITFISHFQKIKGIVVTTQDGILALYLASIDLENKRKSKKTFIEDNVLHLFPSNIKDKKLFEMNSLILIDKIEFNNGIKFEYKSINHSVITTADNRIFKIAFSWINHFIEFYQGNNSNGENVKPSLIVPMTLISDNDEKIEIDMNTKLKIIFLRDKIYCIKSNEIDNNIIPLSQTKYEHEYTDIIKKLDANKNEILEIISGFKSLNDMEDNDDKELSDYIFKFEKSLFNKNMTCFLSDKKLNKLIHKFKELHEEYDDVQEKCFDFTFDMNDKINKLRNQIDGKTQEIDNIVNFEFIDKNKRDSCIKKMICYRGELLDEWINDMNIKYNTQIYNLENNISSNRLKFEHKKKHSFQISKELYRIKFKTLNRLRSINKSININEHKFLCS